ncbi:MAG: NADPH-dependent assimilatory sulfite reductase hemoprotein subunit [Acidobacteriota bacterium]
MPQTATGKPAKKIPAAERAKLDSRHLRGTLEAELAEPGGFPKAELPVLKFHGIYQQENRDERKARRAAGAGKAHTFMVRIALPGGVMTADQYLAVDDITDAHADGSLRLTTRQGVQFHGTGKGDLKPLVRSLHDSLLTTFAACGDVRRNVMACPAPLPGGARRELLEVASAIALELEPKSRAYHEIWLDGEKQSISDGDEPFYGDGYLPRKFKIALATEDDNSVDAYTQDCALVAIVKDDAIVGYHLLAGGGLGMTHNKPDTFARIASTVGTLGPDQAVAAVRAVAAIFRDHGNRQDRRHARLKYLIEDWGLDRFRRELESELGFALGDPLPAPRPHQHDYLGVHDQDGGGVFYGLWIENGRLRDDARTGVRRIVERFRPGVRVTAGQNLLFTDLDRGQIPELEAIAEAHGLGTVDGLPQALRGSMACPALPTCGLALAEAERQLPQTSRLLASALDARGLADVPMVVRMTGCPNGCARPYNADIAFVGRKPGAYHVFVGGGVAGDRLADLWKADVPEADLIPVLEPLLDRFAEERLDDETLGDFYRRVGEDGAATRRLLTGKEEPAWQHWQPAGFEGGRP